MKPVLSCAFVYVHTLVHQKLVTNNILRKLYLLTEKHDFSSHVLTYEGTVIYFDFIPAKCPIQEV